MASRSDSTAVRVPAGGESACSRLSGAVQGPMPVALEATFEPVPVRPVPAPSSRLAGRRPPGRTRPGVFIRAGRLDQTWTRRSTFTKIDRSGLRVNADSPASGPGERETVPSLDRCAKPAYLR